MTCPNLQNLSPVTKRVIGLTLGLLSANVYASVGLIFQFQKGMDILEAMFLREIVLFFGVGVWLFYKKQRFLAARNWFVWGAALKNMELGDAMALYFCKPAFVGVVAYFALKEPFDLLDGLITATLTVGIVFVVQPTFLKQLLSYPNSHLSLKGATNETGFRWNKTFVPENNLTFSPAGRDFDFKTGQKTSVLQHCCHANFSKYQILLNAGLNISGNETRVNASPPLQSSWIVLPRTVAAIFGILGAVGIGCYYILLRKAPDVESFTLMFQSSLILMASTAVLTTSVQTWHLPADTKTWLQQAAITVLTLLGRALLIAAVKLSGATITAISTAAQIPFSYLFQIIILKELPNTLSTTGAVIVTTSVLAVMAKMYFTKRKAEGSNEKNVETSRLMKEVPDKKAKSSH